MTREQKTALKKRLLELLVAAITALIAALSTSCAVRWSSNEFVLRPLGTWHYGQAWTLPLGAATNAPGTNSQAEW